MKPYIVGVAGGSASGKTEIVKTLKKHFEDKIEIIEHDNYYFAHDDLTMEERACLNYDHPQAFETNLLIDHVKKIINNEEIDIPTYDFTIHTRSSDTLKKFPKPIVIVEGILVLENERASQFDGYESFRRLRRRCQTQKKNYKRCCGT